MHLTCVIVMRMIAKHSLADDYYWLNPGHSSRYGYENTWSPNFIFAPLANAFNSHLSAVMPFFDNSNRICGILARSAGVRRADGASFQDFFRFRTISWRLVFGDCPLIASLSVLATSASFQLTSPLSIKFITAVTYSGAVTCISGSGSR